MKHLITLIILTIFALNESIASEVWSGLGLGTNHDVLAIASNDNYVYVGGDFSTAGGELVNCIARWEKSTSTWLPMGVGISGDNPYVTSIIILGMDIYIAGEFTLAGTVSVNNIAKWNELTETWTSLSGGLDDAVDAMTFVGDNLFIVGDFQNAGGLPASRVVKYNINTSLWSALGAGITGAEDETIIISSIVANEEAIFVAGQFTMSDSTVLNNIAKWDLNTSEWSPLLDNSTSETINGVGSTVMTLQFYDNKLYIGGWFTSAGPLSVNGIAMWDGSRWYPIGESIGVDGAQVNDILILDSNRIFIAVMELFSFDGSVRKWDGSMWSKIDGFDPYGGVQDLHLDNDDIYVGGRFGYFGGDYDYIAKFEDPENPFVFSNLVLKVFLEGTYNDGALSTSLNSNGNLPIYQPYNQSPWNYLGTEEVSSEDISPQNGIPDFFDTHPNIVDWVLVELRTDINSETSINKKACFILNDGSIIGADASSPLLLNDFGNYYIVLHHRNHLPIISSEKVKLTN